VDKANTWLFHTFTRYVGAWNQRFMSANTSPKVELLLGLKQSQPWSNARDVRQHKSVDTCLDLPNKLIWQYHVIPTHLMELWWNFSPCLGRLKDGAFHLSLLLSLFPESIGDNMILWFLNIGHTCTLFGMLFLTLAQQLFILILLSVGWICGTHG
jgi:hypothetical protein